VRYRQPSAIERRHSVANPGHLHREMIENHSHGHAGGRQYAYGPVPSRRLGKSLGINHIPAKCCTYSCVYCQLGKTTRLEIDRRRFYDPQEIVRDVRSRIVKAQKAAERVDYLTFVPDGEPSLDAHLGEEIARLKPLGLPVGVITNGSLVSRPDVREALGKADWVSLKIDAVNERLWRRINRPHPALRLAPILDGMLDFAKTFTGRLATETMLVQGLNDHDGSTRQMADFIQTLKPDAAYLSIPTRPAAEKWVCGPDADTLNRAYQLFAEKVKRVEYLIGYEGNAFAFTGDIENDLLGITAVHPMRKEAVCELLSRAGASWQVIDRLVASGDLMETNYNGHKFYLRKFKNPNEDSR
jgi:wyosine [tRNA(Phe)-imidazoG37] synthetase (radical SAM superfamily)